MLSHLFIRNLAVFAEATVELEEGLNVLTGETGAGKSIVVDSLSLLAGDRAKPDLIRTGADVLTVTGTFEHVPPECITVIEEAAVASDADELVIRREVSRGGRNRVFVNDHPITLRLLKVIAPHLLRIHGQRDEIGLFQTALQRSWLDRQGGEEGAQLLASVAELFEEVRIATERLEHSSGDERLRHERVDLLTYQLGEIETANLEAGEEVRLRQERDVLRNSEQISAALAQLVSRLVDAEGSVTEHLAALEPSLAEIVEWEPESKGWRAEIEELRIRAEEVARSGRARMDRVEADPTRLAGIEDRLASIERLLRKYGANSAEVIAKAARMREELEQLNRGSENEEELRERVEAALESYRQAACELSAMRQLWASDLVAQVQDELVQLALPDARLEVAIERRSREDSLLIVGGQAVDFWSYGVDEVSYLFSPNPGEDLRPLSRVASGGELSRVYLALQLLGHSAAEGQPTLVFDEVDAGVGGVEAVILGRKLRKLGEAAQVLSVTHLPQVASQGEHHFRVEKEVSQGRTFVRVEPLQAEARVEEIARMLGGEEAGVASLSHAQEMLAEAAAG